jgi:transketolase
MSRSEAQLNNIQRGGYVLKDCDGKPKAILIATGSEVSLAMDAAGELRSKGVAVRVVSMPCAELFDAQDSAYRDSVLPPEVRVRVAVEAGYRDYWYKYVGLDGRVVGMSTFGESAPGDQLMKQFGFTVENVVEAVKAVL